MLERFQMKTKKAPLPERDFLDRVALIRSIQRAEGNPDCFRKAQGGCDQFDCTWRKFCVEEAQKYPLEPGSRQDMEEKE